MSAGRLKVSYLIAGAVGFIAPFIIIVAYELIKRIPNVVAANVTLAFVVVLVVAGCLLGLYQGDAVKDIPVMRVFVLLVTYGFGHYVCHRLKVERLVGC